MRYKVHEKWTDRNETFNPKYSWEWSGMGIPVHPWFPLKPGLPGWPRGTQERDIKVSENLFEPQSSNGALQRKSSESFWISSWISLDFFTHTSICFQRKNNVNQVNGKHLTLEEGKFAWELQLSGSGNVFGMLLV